MKTNRTSTTITNRTSMSIRTNAKRKASALSVGVATLALAVGGISSTAVAQTKVGENDSKKTCTVCTLETLKGRYLFAWSGTLLPPAFGVTEPTAGGSAGYHTFNGDGTGTDTVTVRIGTQIVLEKAVAPITYTVNPDCTGSYTVNVPDGPSFDLFIAPNGEEIATFATAPAGNQLASIDRRVSRATSGEGGH
jgi:hypothetical protein